MEFKFDEMAMDETADYVCDCQTDCDGDGSQGTGCQNS